MKKVNQIYQALLDGETLVYITLETSACCNFTNPKEWEIYNKWSNLKKAYKEGAKIQVKKNSGWNIDDNPSWEEDKEYRIKGDISIESWNKHKKLIKAWWGGNKIECLSLGIWYSIVWPSWHLHYRYRINPST